MLLLWMGFSKTFTPTEINREFLGWMSFISGGKS